MYLAIQTIGGYSMAENLIDLIRREIRFVVDPLLLRLQYRLWSDGPNGRVLHGSIIPEDRILSVAGSVQQATVLCYTASSLGKGRVVVATGSYYHDGSNSYPIVRLVDLTNTADPVTIVGVTTESAGGNSTVPVMYRGILHDPDIFSFTPRSRLYAGSNGVLTETPPSTGFVCSVGYSLTPDRIYVRVSTQPVMLA